MKSTKEKDEIAINKRNKTTDAIVLSATIGELKRMGGRLRC